MESPLEIEELKSKIQNKENVSKVDTSRIHIMNNLFSAKRYHLYRGLNFNQPLNDWDVSNVYEMQWMFFDTNKFNQPLDKWDVSNVTNMYGMFDGTLSFNQPLNDWDVSNVENMGNMFQNAKSFNQPLNDWDVSNVESMGNMFQGAKKFNQSLNEWDVSNVYSIELMFANASNYTGSMKDWKLRANCDYLCFLEKCHLWHLVNTVEDLPMQNGERIDIGGRKIWKVL